MMHELLCSCDSSDTDAATSTNCRVVGSSRCVRVSLAAGSSGRALILCCSALCLSVVKVLLVNYSTKTNTTFAHSETRPDPFYCFGLACLYFEKVVFSIVGSFVPPL